MDDEMATGMRNEEISFSAFHVSLLFFPSPYSDLCHLMRGYTHNLRYY